MYGVTTGHAYTQDGDPDFPDFPSLTSIDVSDESDESDVSDVSDGSDGSERERERWAEAEADSGGLKCPLCERVWGPIEAQVWEIFEMFDTTREGRLDMAAYQRYLRGIGAWNQSGYTDAGWDEKWPIECATLGCTAATGVTRDGFKALYIKYRCASSTNVATDLASCRASEQREAVAAGVARAQSEAVRAPGLPHLHCSSPHLALGVAHSYVTPVYVP